MEATKLPRIDGSYFCCSLRSLTAHGALLTSARPAYLVRPAERIRFRKPNKILALALPFHQNGIAPLDEIQRTGAAAQADLGSRRASLAAAGGSRLDNLMATR